MRRFVMLSGDYLVYFVIFALLPLRRLHRLLRNTTRSVWTGAPIINLAINARGERLLGVNACSLVASTYFITNAFDIVLSRYGVAPGWNLIKRYLAWVWICLTADRVHAYVDGGILVGDRRYTFNERELRSYVLCGIDLFVWTYGADVRTRARTQALGPFHCCTDCTVVGTGCICDDRLGNENYARVKAAARAVFAMGDMLEYTPGSRNDLYFWPIDFSRDGGEYYAPAYPVLVEGRPLRVVHAPNHREFKGTRYLEEAVAQLRAEGVPIELVLVERKPNAEAMSIYRTADVVFDQCLIGFHGFFALEALALGKPVMCFIRYPEHYLLSPQECPIINTSRDTVKEDLRQLVVRRDELNDLGRQGRRYVEQHMSLEAFSQRLAHAYQDLGVEVSR